MQRCKLEISAGALGAALYLTGLFNGGVAMLLLAGYVLLFEENGWLRRTAVRAVVILFLFSALSAGISLLPSFLGLLNAFAGLFHGYLSFSAVSSLVYIVNTGIEMARVILLLALAWKALKQETFVLPGLERKIDRCMG